MQLRKVDIHQDKTLRKKVKELYYSAFPKAERIPWWILWLSSRRKDIDVWAYLDGEIFAGLTVTVATDEMYFLYYLATEETLRSKGYGSAILSAIKEEYDQVVLNMEPLDPAADNILQRKRRFAFYKRNGFCDTGYHVWEVGGKFRILSTNPVFDREKFKKIFKKLTFGVWNVRVEKA